MGYRRENAVVRAVREVSPAVVNISTRTLVNRPSPFSGPDPLFDSFFRDFFESRPRRPRYQRSSLGSGVIIDGTKGFILTNAHVISRAGKITVTLRDEREFEATIVGADPDSDLAVLRIRSETPLPAVKMGGSADLMIGEDVIAIGNPFGFSHTVTTGVISALNRSIRAEETVYHDFIQTDASINPGNSGGPLLNINGVLIGINTAIYAKAQGIGFAIPISRARRIVEDLIRYGEVTAGWLGIMVQNLDPSLARYMNLPRETGVLARKVDRDSPAHQADIREGDILLSVGSLDIHSAGGFNAALRGYAVGDRVNITLRRDGKTLRKSLRTAEFPADRAAALGYTLLGVRVREMKADRRARYGGGVVISEIRPRSRLAGVGVKPGDVIRQIDAAEIKGVKDFEKAVIRYRNKGSVVLLLQRGRQGYYITVKF
ncbi:peptidase S1 [Desulfonema ishimotonii]|uniref:Peptidase S1 n=1 Tax=Desulfonema ishimotonii TaxID=45657 RepID=A0A401G3J1_9BACT|nr:trypsin-like peptidase domain-containing protein [Desulfonema ishimotonii]GBC63807.1 peptidase S1 [Desulfonema ishimotonii]